MINRLAQPLIISSLLWLGGIAPLLYLLGLALSHNLGVNPIEYTLHYLGTWGLNLLLITLAITPCRRRLGWRGLARYRRRVGLYAFFYLLLHLLAYTILEQFFDWQAIVEDIVKRPYITLGMISLLLLLPLALTSHRSAIKRLGHYWQGLHRLIYLAALLGVAHYLLLTRADMLYPMLYALLLALLLGERLLYALRS
ncbi:sulfoxide reductase heme-binding subunit YedZ [Ectothiorhodospiraceae bacterium BW-2]|nr:sulfoxide reductase heme-binding subunit YedZ [Ectothiorhodospiraceae bacterium BW-2]